MGRRARRALTAVAVGAVVVVAAALVLPACLRLPLGADRAELARFAAAPPPAPVTVTVTPLELGAAKQPRCALAGEASCWRRVRQVYAAYLVHHPRATFLVDAGVSSQVRTDLRRFSLLTRLAFAFRDRGGLAAALAQAGGPHVDFVLLTHAHWDHASGLTDLPGVKVLTTPEELSYVRQFHGREPTVMPEHFARATVDTFAWDGPPYENFPVSHDLFGDGSVVAVPLPGHTPGSLGVFVRTAEARLFFVGDAVWSRDGIRIPSHRAKPLSHLVDADVDRTSETIWRLHHLQERDPELVIVPAHDGDALDEVARLTGR
jgi:glyoxylase-like metal-dependent hydrolase (beta-lactamase superfamily II)